MARTSIDFLLHQQRAEREEIAARADERRAAPLRMRRRGEDRLVEHVLPVARELALGEDGGLERVLAAALARDDHVLAQAAGRGAAARDGIYAELAERLHQAEA